MHLLEVLLRRFKTSNVMLSHAALVLLSPPQRPLSCSLDRVGWQFGAGEKEQRKRAGNAPPIVPCAPSHIPLPKGASAEETASTIQADN